MWTCNKTFSYKGNLSAHVKQAHLCVRFICVNTALNHFLVSSISHFIYQLLPTGVKPHACNTCGKSFTQSSTLTNHLRSVHLGEKFMCETCNKTFTLKHHLSAHVKQAHLGKGFICEHCSKSFATKQNLSQHLLNKTIFIVANE